MCHDPLALDCDSMYQVENKCCFTAGNYDACVWSQGVHKQLSPDSDCICSSLPLCRQGTAGLLPMACSHPHPYFLFIT